MKWLAILLSVQAILLSACASAQKPSEPVDDQFVLPSSSDKPGGASVAGSPLPSGSRIVTGALGFDSIEGGCAYVETADGTRYEVIYPDGWQIDRATGKLVGPNGEVVKPGGPVSVRGSIATHRSSICQLGPIFQATEVLSAGD